MLHKVKQHSNGASLERTLNRNWRSASPWQRAGHSIDEMIGWFFWTKVTGSLDPKFQAEAVFRMLGFCPELTWLVAQEDFIKISHHESCKSINHHSYSYKCLTQYEKKTISVPHSCLFFILV
jgi:hypothetical protein